jgi:DNA replication protein DnaC
MSTLTAPPPTAASAILTSYLTQLRLPTMAASCAAVAREAAASNLDYLAFLTLLSGQEVAHREQAQAARRLAQAQFPWPKTLDEFDFSAVPSVKQAAVLQLASGAFVRAHENWLVLGGPGVGKTHLLCGVGRLLCQHGFRVRFRSAAALVNELLLADQEHRLHKLLKQWRSIDLVIVDELGYLPFSTAGAQVLFQFFADRHEVASVAISSNLEFGRFTEVFHDERMTAALLDRLTFKSTVMVIEGDSYRLKESLRRQAGG